MAHRQNSKAVRVNTSGLTYIIIEEDGHCEQHTNINKRTCAACILPLYILHSTQYSYG